MREAEERLQSAETVIAQTEQKALGLGDATATTARKFEKLNSETSQTYRKLSEAITAFNKGEISAKQLDRAITGASNSFNRLENRAKDTSARLTDVSNKAGTFTSRMSLASAAGNLFSNAISNIASEAKQFVAEGIKMNASLDKLVRFTSTLDKSFQNPIALKRFTQDIKALSEEIPHSAEKIAEASFSIKSAFSDLTEPQTIEFLRQFGLAATASNADIADFTKNTVALAKVFKVEMKDLPSFMARVNATFKQGLAADSDVAQGFNKLTTSITAAKLSTEDFLAAFSTVQSTTADAAGATTNLQNALSKLGDAKYIEDLDKVFNIDRFTKEGGLKSLNEIVNELAKSLQGLTDEQKLTKLNAVFKDLQANQGILALINNIDTYNKLLKDATGAEAFKNTQNVMLGSVESRWAKFWNSIKNDQSGIGGSISDFFLSAFDSTTVVGGIGIFFNNVVDAILQGVVRMGRAFMGIVQTIGDSLLGLFFDADKVAEFSGKFDKFFNDVSAAITRGSESNIRTILEKEKANWQKIADATADPETKAKALKNVESLNKAIQ